MTPNHLSMTNPNKWIYDPIDITSLNAQLDGIAGLMEIDGNEGSKVIRSAIDALYEMSEQQIHICSGIEKLKEELTELKTV